MAGIDRTKLKAANKAPLHTPDEVLKAGARSYAVQIAEHGAEGSVEAVVMLVSKRDGRIFWGSTLPENQAAEVIKAVARKVEHGVVIAPASALPRI